jgi:phosphotransacetylase
MQNLWEKERKGLFRELYHQYIDEGYDQKEAKRLAKQEAEELMSDTEQFAFGVVEKEGLDDY